MDAFGDGNFEQQEIDPAAEFLAREQNALAGLEDEIPPVDPVSAATTAGNDDQKNDDVTQPPSTDVLGGLEFESNGSFEMINSDFEATQTQPAADEQLQQQQQRLDGDDAFLDGDFSSNVNANNQQDDNDDFSGYRVPVVHLEEPERIRKWREEQKARLEQKDREEELKKEELREQARKELEDWYKHHDEAISKTKAANRNAEKQFVAETDEIEPGTEWERIAKLCDFNPKTNKSSKDISRMRSIILQLKQNPIATNGKKV
ncbi:clathrin light chain isoform X2 [Uranotaenia lowii]|uniref:clathrin light chain isoform X2 n=1 Tax=Uranotaenia lowii TaxID=190385 RepID=UPI0024798CC6|nr:clathrin light chain isoform X2 [Uranotaenia lowii]